MPRSELAGFTDYRHQSLQDMVSDLKTWIENLKDTIHFLSDTTKELERIGYWKKVDPDFQSINYYAMRFFNTADKEITSILAEIEKEVKPNHIDRIRRLFEVAHELNDNYGKVWHSDYTYKKEYGREEFKLVEELYANGRDMAVDMLDLSNLAMRLKDFVGYEAKPKSGKTSRFSWLMLSPNFYGIGINLKKFFSRWKE